MRWWWFHLCFIIPRNPKGRCQCDLGVLHARRIRHYLCHDLPLFNDLMLVQDTGHYEEELFPLVTPSTRLCISGSGVVTIERPVGLLPTHVSLP